MSSIGVPLLNRVIEELDEEHLRQLVYQYTYSCPEGAAEVFRAMADQKKAY
jgi:hypothetical protein